MTLEEIKNAIIQDPENDSFRKKGWLPLYSVSENSKIAIIGQAPGLKAQEKNKAWDDASGKRLREWLGVNEEIFYNPDFFAILPMDFYYPGKGKSGDLPPRKEFARIWHQLIFENTKDLKLILLMGSYAQAFYLADTKKERLTETVKNFQSYLPQFFPLVHPSPRNRIWQSKNPWFDTDVLPFLKETVKKIINS
jgi:uracil-DNA glycosylase